MKKLIKQPVEKFVSNSLKIKPKLTPKPIKYHILIKHSTG